MSKYQKRFSQQDKLEILNYFEQNGGARTKRRYDVSITAIYKWRDILEEFGADGLINRSTREDIEHQELERLKRENRALKALVAEKELALRLKDELLKKSSLPKPSK